MKRYLIYSLATLGIMYYLYVGANLLSKARIRDEKQNQLDSIKKENLILEIEEKKIRLKMLNGEIK